MAGLTPLIEQQARDYQISLERTSLERLDRDMDHVAAGGSGALNSAVSISSLERLEVIHGAVRLSLMDSRGLTHVLDLRAHAEAQISTALLTAHKDENGIAHRRGPVMADDIRVAMFIPPPGADSKALPTLMLEIDLTDKATLEVALPEYLEQKLLGRLLQRQAARGERVLF